MQTTQSLSIPFPEFATFATLPQEDIPKEPLQSPILEESLLNICKYHKKVLPLQILKTQHMCNNQLNVL
jgi:hypothetical protein